MANKNEFAGMSLRATRYKKKYANFYAKFVSSQYETLTGNIKNRTPEDDGDLKGRWSFRLKSEGEKMVFVIHNPANYAAHVEYGYDQKPGMILKMKMERGKLRFVSCEGFTFKIGTGKSDNKVEPDEEGYYTIVTRRRAIPGKHMVRDSVNEFRENLAKEYFIALGEFQGRNGVL